MDPKPNTEFNEAPLDRADFLHREADANAEQSAKLARHIRTFAQTAEPSHGDEHWAPALPFDPKA